MILKVCGVTNPADAELAVELGASYVGVIVGAKSPRLIDPQRASDIASVLPKHVKLVGVVDARKSLDLDVILNSDVEVVQLHWASYQAYSRAKGILEGYDISIALASQSFKGWPLERLETEYVLVDVKDHARKPEEVGRARALGDVVGVAGSLTPENVKAVINSVKVDMVDVSSGVEERPGKKDRRKLSEFARAVVGTL